MCEDCGCAKSTKKDIASIVEFLMEFYFDGKNCNTWYWRLFRILTFIPFFVILCVVMVVFAISYVASALPIYLVTGKNILEP